MKFEAERRCGRSDLGTARHHISRPGAPRCAPACRPVCQATAVQPCERQAAARTHGPAGCKLARPTVERAGCKRLPTARRGPNGPLFNSRVRSRRATNAGKVAPAVHQDHGLPLLNLLREGTGAQGGWLGRASGTLICNSRLCLSEAALTASMYKARICIHVNMGRQ